MIFAAALSAVMTLLFAVLVAPKKRVLVARVVFLAGSIYATYFAFSISAWAEFVGAILAGFITLLLLTKKYGGRTTE
jgi:predicted branched-subunit amino acid permease